VLHRFRAVTFSPAAAVRAVTDEIVSFVQVGRHRLAATVFGRGDPAVVIEPGFGDGAARWHPIAAGLAGEVTVLAYDRAPYGASSPATDGRSPQEIATDLRGLVTALGLTGPLVLVGHSSGGRSVRQFASMYPDAVAGMVLVDSSHEAQQQLLLPRLPWKLRLRELLTPATLLFDRRLKMSMAARRSMLREYRALGRQTAADKPLAAGALGHKPLIVLTRAPGPVLPRRRGWQVWHDLHRDLAQLSLNHRHVVADSAEHDLHVDAPALVTGAIRDVVRSARTSEPLGSGED
jgi:pimeloyl-ACP methyl ester carboxylesterase